MFLPKNARYFIEKKIHYLNNYFKIKNNNIFFKRINNSNEKNIYLIVMFQYLPIYTDYTDYLINL